MMNPCAIIGLVLALLAGGGGAWVNGMRWEARYTALERDHAITLATAHAQAEQRQRALNETVRKANDDLEISRAENARLAGSVAAGAARLYVRATCPSLPAADPAAGGVAAAAPELDPAARADYFALRGELAEQFATLTKCRELALKLIPEK